jgi:hypothetical protein
MLTDNDKSTKGLLFSILILAGIIVLCFLCFSCNPTQKAIKRLDKNPEAASEYCAAKYPTKDSIVINDVISYDTVTNEVVEVDTIYKVEDYSDTVIMEVTKTLPAKTIVKKVAQIKEVFRENTARLANLEIRNAVSDAEKAKLIEQGDLYVKKIKELKRERNKWRLYFFILLAATLTVLVREKFLKKKAK